MSSFLQTVKERVEFITAGAPSLRVLGARVDSTVASCVGFGLHLILGGAALQRCGNCIVLIAAFAAEVTSDN